MLPINNQGKSIKRKALAGILLSTVLVVSMTACGSKDTNSAASSAGSADKGSDVIRIAEIGPFSGGAAALGEWDNQGIMMAVDTVNAKGGIHGKKIEIVKMDDQGNPTLTVNAAKKIINNDKVVAAFAAPLSTTTLAALDLFNQAKIPQVSGGQSPAITSKGSQYIFRDTASSTVFTKTAADYIVNKMGAKKVAVFTNSGAFGKGEHDTFVAALKSMNVTPVAEQVVTPDAKEFSAQLTNIKAANPDVLYIGAEDIQSGLVVKQARALGMSAKVVGGDSLGTATYINTAGKDNAEGTIFITQFFANASEETKAFSDAYKQKYGKQAEFHIAKGYDGAEMLIEAMNKAYPNLDGEHIRDAMRQLSFHGLTGDYKFDEKGEGLDRAQVGIVKNGKAEPVK
jgi:branched-chain amino acid transport system substrate-binding protein